MPRSRARTAPKRKIKPVIIDSTTPPDNDPVPVFDPAAEIATQQLGADGTDDEPTVADLTDGEAELLNALQARILTKPKTKKNRKRTADHLSEPTNKKQKRAPKPAWLHKNAVLHDLLPILEIQDGSEMVYITVAEQCPPYNQFNTKIVRHILRMAKKHPSICSEWNTVTLQHDSDFVSIPLNGRNASRGAGLSQNRAFSALNAITDLGCADVGVATLKDLGYGSSKAREFKALWDLHAVNAV
jgi:hypothetical protein